MVVTLGSLVYLYVKYRSNTVDIADIAKVLVERGPRASAPFTKLVMLTSVWDILSDEEWRSRGYMPSKVVVDELRLDPNKLKKNAIRPVRTWFSTLQDAVDKLTVALQTGTSLDRAGAMAILCA